MTKMRVPKHGASEYNNHGCRCDICKRGWADYRRERGYQQKYQAGLREKGLTGAGKPRQVPYFPRPKALGPRPPRPMAGS